MPEIQMSPQQTIAHYRITTKLGEGGMGVVWRAMDTRLNREVAIKVLPAAFADDPQYMARFEREAQTLAALHHPNIATVFGIETGAEGAALVMELVDGPTLAERMSQGPIPIDETLHIARQIVAGLEAAHERGIIHRDLKPANIKINSAGAVKLLDFGLAKAAGDSVAQARLAGANPTISPTLSLAMTQAGMILGTAAYMSPEQARGKPVDRRADIWSFGVVVWEMLTGRHLFGGGETVTDTLASVVKDTPDLAALPAATPANVRRILERCLRKEPRSRLRDIGEARVMLDEASEVQTVEVAPSVAGARPSSRWSWIVSAVSAFCVALLALVHFSEAPPKAPQTLRFEVAVPASGSIGRFLSISPDGRTLAWADGVNIYVRPIDDFEPRVLVSTRAEGYLFWSPDSKQLGFLSEGKLKRIALTGGPVETICETVASLGTVWTNDNQIITGGNTRGLLRVPASGGTLQPIKIIGASADAQSYNWPVLLPGGKKLMYTSLRTDRPAMLMVADLQKDGALANPRELREEQYGAQFLKDADGRGYIVFVRNTTLMAQAFDPDAAALSEVPITLAEPVGSYRTRGFFAVASGGTIVYRTGETVGVRPELVDRSGAGEAAKTVPGSVLDVAVSPDGRGILATVSKPGMDTIWVFDPARGAHTRITFDDAPARGPIWSPDGRSIVYWSKGLWLKPANGSGTAEKIAPAGFIVWCWSRDGKNLVVSKGITRESAGLFLLPLDGDRKPVPLLPSQFVLTQAQFSPDNHWIAYVSDESGESEIYVQRLPATGERVRISNSGGVQPRWSRDGREIFYVEPRGKLMAVALRYGKTLEADEPVPLFDARLSSLSATASPRYDVTPDGKHFYLSRVPETQSTSPLRMILNWRGATR